MFLKIAFDIKNLRQANDPDQSYFKLTQKEKLECYGAKLLVAGNDITFHNFVQDYVQSVLNLKDTKNQDLSELMSVYLLPNSFNSIASFIASREPLYRQNVYQFFSAINSAYNKLVKPGGLV